MSSSLASPASRLDHFVRYARSISSRFDVDVEFDGYKAHTDGRVITLPNIAALSPAELDALYAILLHEVGHVRYSDFSPVHFESMPSQAFAMMFNCLEDARIENLLMKDFDGARDMFQDLYTVHAADPAVMKRLFGWRGRGEQDMFWALGQYAHAFLLDIPDVPFAALTTARLKDAVLEFVASKHVDTHLASAAFATTSDVLALTRVLYDLYYSRHADHSERVDFNKVAKAVADAAGALSGAIPQSVLDDISGSNRRLAEVRKEYGEAKSRYNSESPALLSRARSRQEEARGMSNYRKASGKVERASAALAQASRKLRSEEARKGRVEEAVAKARAAAAARRSSAVEAVLDRISAARSQPSSAARDRRVAALEDRLSSLREKYDEVSADSLRKHAERMDKAESRVDTLRQKVDKLSGRLADAEADRSSAALAAPGASGMSSPEIKERIVSLRREAKAQVSRVGDMAHKVRDLREEISSLERDLERLRERVGKLGRTALKKAQSILDKAGVSHEVVPRIEPTKDWPAADRLQEDFDTHASDKANTIVTGGAGIGTGARDMLVFLDKRADGVKQIDLADHFQKLLRPSRLDQVNERLGDMRVQAQPLPGQSSAVHAHVPASTAFDTTAVVRPPSDLRAIDEIRSRLAPDLRALSAVFRSRLKFSKKDKFRGNRDEGLIDPRSAWKLASGHGDDFFEVNLRTPSNKVAASIAIDLSGSMDRPSTDHGKRVLELSLMLSDALSSCYVRHEIVGYHAPISDDLRAAAPAGVYNRRMNRLEHLVFRSFTDRRSDAISALEIKASDNSDAESIGVIASRLRRHPARGRILFVITDGMPFLSGASTDMMDAALRDLLARLAADNIQVFALGFNDYPAHFYGGRYFRVTSWDALCAFCSSALDQSTLFARRKAVSL